MVLLLKDSYLLSCSSSKKKEVSNFVLGRKVASFALTISKSSWYAFLLSRIVLELDSSLSPNVEDIDLELIVVQIQ